MSLQEQIETIKKSWLLIALILVLFLTIAFTGVFILNSASMSQDSVLMDTQSSRTAGFSNLAPEIAERIVVQTANLQITIQEFSQTEKQLQTTVQEYQAIIADQNVNTVRGKYVNARYTLNVPTQEYDRFVEDLKELGEVTSFRENTRDITGAYLNLQDLLEFERELLQGYEQVYEEERNAEAKMTVLKEINNQKSKIRSLENRLADQDERLEYTQIHLTLSEKRPRHATVDFPTTQDLWSGIKASTNVLVWIITYLIPFIIVGALIVFIRRKTRRKKEY